jgi:hypothetical protein
VFAVVTEPNLVVREPLDELAVTVPEMAIPLETAARISVLACVPRLTTVWAVMCCPLERMVERVVAVWLPSKMESAI